MARRELVARHCTDTNCRPPRVVAPPGAVTRARATAVETAGEEAVEEWAPLVSSAFHARTARAPCAAAAAGSYPPLPSTAVAAGPNGPSPPGCCQSRCRWGSARHCRSLRTPGPPAQPLGNPPSRALACGPAGALGMPLSQPEARPPRPGGPRPRRCWAKRVGAQRLYSGQGRAGAGANVAPTRAGAPASRGPRESAQASATPASSILVQARTPGPHYRGRARATRAPSGHGRQPLTPGRLP
mmetsp:Transcript_58275/g.173427  ORF Transcript_58275/g.173427 Transcript_58275/m.173427 type:complete len:242 (+) Transcript_58275:328-1053(+)